MQPRDADAATLQSPMAYSQASPARAATEVSPPRKRLAQIRPAFADLPAHGCCHPVQCRIVDGAFWGLSRLVERGESQREGISFSANNANVREFFLGSNEPLTLKSVSLRQLSRLVERGETKRRRRDIFVVRTIHISSSSVRRGIFRPDGALVFSGLASYKDFEACSSHQSNPKE